MRKIALIVAFLSSAYHSRRIHGAIGIRDWEHQSSRSSAALKRLLTNWQVEEPDLLPALAKHFLVSDPITAWQHAATGFGGYPMNRLAVKCATTRPALLSRAFLMSAGRGRGARTGKHGSRGTGIEDTRVIRPAEDSEVPRVLIVGAGCTGAATALKLREKLGKQVAIHVWEKARGAGGRFTTSRDAYPDGMRADLGAQYASVDPKEADAMALMESIVSRDAAVLVPDENLAETEERPRGTTQYRGTSGQNGIVKTLLLMAEAEVTYKRRVSRLDLNAGSWAATAYDGAKQRFDCICLCVPGCGPGGDNLNKIHGNWEAQMTKAKWER